MSVYRERKSWRYEVQWNHQRITQSGFASYEAAYEAMIKHRIDLRKGIPHKPRVVKQGQYYEENRVRGIFRLAFLNGEIAKPDNCQDCGAHKKLVAHHADYSKPYDVEWLCIKCHSERHNHQLRKPKTGVPKSPYYRTQKIKTTRQPHSKKS